MLQKHATTITRTLRLLNQYGIPTFKRATTTSPINKVQAFYKKIGLPYKTNTVHGKLSLNKPLINDLMNDFQLQGRPLFKPKDLGRMGTIKKHQLLPKDFISVTDDIGEKVNGGYLKPSKQLSDINQKLGLSLDDMFGIYYDPKKYSEAMHVASDLTRNRLYVNKPKISLPTLAHEAGHVQNRMSPRTTRLDKATHRAYSFSGTNVNTNVLRNEINATNNALQNISKIPGVSATDMERYDDYLRNAYQTYLRKYLYRFNFPNSWRLSLRGPRPIREQQTRRLLRTLGISDKYKNYPNL